MVRLPVPVFIRHWSFGVSCLSAAAEDASGRRPGRGTVALAGRILLPLFVVVCLALSSGGCSLPKKVPAGPSVEGSRISKTALSAVGTRYVMGGTSPGKGFDCSGLVCWAYAKNGLSVPRTARDQSKLGSSISKKSLREGDLVVFKIRSGMHTGIYTGKGRFVHSPSRGKTVRVDKIDSIYWKDKFVAGRRHARLH